MSTGRLTKRGRVYQGWAKAGRALAGRSGGLTNTDTNRVTLRGTSQQRLTIHGESQQRIKLSGESQYRFTIRGQGE